MTRPARCCAKSACDLRVSDEAVLAVYRATTWTVDAPAGPLPVRPGEPVAPDSLPLPAAVLTAYNPRSEIRTASENRRANEALAEELRRCGLEPRAALAHGSGPGQERWDEPGFLVTGGELRAVVTLAARFDQNAILWIGADGVPVIVSARAGFAGSVPGAVL